MKTTLKFLSASFAMGAMLMLTGCPTTGGDDCTLDTDCTVEGEICNTDTNTCEAQAEACETTADCTTEGDLCIASVNNDGTFACGVPTNCGDIKDDAEKNTFCDGATAGDVCLATADDAAVFECRAPADCSEAADAVAYCTTELGEIGENEAAVCNTDGDAPVCEKVSTLATVYKHILIVDETEEDCTKAEDNNEFDPGSDIMYVEHNAADGSNLGYGAAVEANYPAEAEESDFPNIDVIDGAAPDLNEGGCPNLDQGMRFTDQTVYSLGCGGDLLVEFDVALENDHIIKIGEYATICNKDDGTGSMTGTDKYDAYLCASEEGTTDFSTVITDCLDNGVSLCASTDGGIKDCTVSGVPAAEAPAEEDGE